MPLYDPSQALAPSDKLLVFISSTIGECAEEREAASAGVRHTNNEPVVFEKLGARPYPPRDVYLSRLRQSHIVVAIYKNSYGYIDEPSGMTVSGLEDEYRHAVKFGTPILAFVHKDAAGRDERLARLLSEIMSGDHTITVAFYGDPAQLADLVREGVTAVITQRFLDAATLEQTLRQTSTAAIDRSAPPGGVVERSDLLAQIRAASQSNAVVAVSGPAGSGKTVLMSELGAANGFETIFARNLSPKELFAVLVNKLRRLKPDAAQQFNTFEGARLAFASAWVDADSATLVLDDCPHIDAVIKAIGEAGVTNARKALIYSTRSDGPLGDGGQIVAVPPLSLEEVREIITKSGLSPERASDMLGASGGNPLALRQAIVASGRSITDVWNALTPRVRDVTTYLAIADTPLTAEDLLELVGDASYKAFELFAEVEATPELIAGTGEGFRIVHEAVRAELKALVAAKVERLQFSAGRLARHLASSGRIVAAYLLLADMGHKDAPRLLERASFEAARSGDWKASQRLATDALANATARGDRREMTQQHLFMAQALEMSGDLQGAGRHLAEAEASAADTDPQYRQHVQGVALTFAMFHSLTPQSIANLRDYRDGLIGEDRDWLAARVSMDMSAAYIHLHDAPTAEQAARSALATFETVGDEYGIELARRNLASALVAQSGKEAEADELIKAIEADAGTADGRRSRAWLCNVLVRRNRTAGHPEIAETYAREAIAIGRELGDEVVIAINGIGLGNALSDLRRYEEAIAAYDDAARTAQRCRRAEIEAQASYLAASTYNELPDKHPLASDGPQRAEMLARYAVGLMRGTLARDHMSRGLEALSDALYGQGRVSEAVEASFEAASFSLAAQSWDTFERQFMSACHNVPEDDVERYLRGIASGLNLDPSQWLSADTTVETMFRPLDEVLRLLPRNVILPFFGLHLHRTISTLPRPVTRRVIDLMLEIVKRIADDLPEEEWRVLYSAMVLAAGGGPVLSSYDYMRMAEAVTDSVSSLYARPEDDGGCQWLVTLDLPTPVAISIMPMDASSPTTLACLLLALFFKAFEPQLRDDLFSGVSLQKELTINIGNFADMPEDVQSLIASSLKGQSVTVSRPTKIAEDDPSLPTNVFLADSFISELVVGEGRGGSLQALCGITAIEVAYRMLRGTVEIDALGPKVVRLVRESIS